MFSRRLTPPTTTTLLLGPRATGKSTWLETVLPQAHRWGPTRHPRGARSRARFVALRREVEALPRGAWVVVDEVQKVPALLDDLHRLDGKHGRRFVLSSAFGCPRGS